VSVYVHAHVTFSLCLSVSLSLSLCAAANAIIAAKAQGIEADDMYCRELLEETGIVVVPGSGFWQKDGTFHFRTTILPPNEQMTSMVKSLGTFHAGFLVRYQ
jgi:alanine transaminase